MVPPPDETAQSLGDGVTGSDVEPSGPEDAQSLGDQHTFDGVAKDTSPQSLGDAQTVGGTDPDGETPFDDGMEVVDLDARYTTEGVLGKGGMGEVLLATDTRLERKVAIKRILGDGARSRTAISRFLTEAKSIAALNHPNIVQIYDYGRAADGPFLIMEFVEGNSLLDRLRDEAMPLEEAIELTCQLCDGLGMAHEANIIHRDIKPANVLLTKTGIPKLTDFGLAKDETADSGLSVAGAVLGTLDFMPPEQRKDAALTDRRSDLWALAATLYQMVTGKSPRIIRFNDVPQSLQDVLGKALEDEKDDRYQTAAEFRDALRASQQDTGSEELEEGSCPSCGTKNPTNRKFCKNPDCSTSLEVPCLSCSSKIPMWEQVCDSCGKPQGDLLQQRRDSMVSSQSEAESLLKVYDFDRASELATALRDEPDLRLQHLKGWAEKFLPQIDQGRQQQLEQIGGQLTEAAAHEQAHDHAAGLRVLEKVPEILREARVSGHSDTVAGVMSRLQSTLQEIKRLDTEIRQRVESRKVNGLQSEVNQLLELQPDRKDISQLKAQLLERERKLNETRDKAYTAAKQKLSAQDYDGVLKEIARIDESMLQDAISQLRDEAIEKRDRLKTLRAAISEGVKAKKLHGLLKKVDECLSLKSDDAELEKLRGQLQAREEKNAAQVANVIEKAQSLREECRFEAAANALRRIPQEQVTQEASDLLKDCDALGALREMSLRSLKSAMDSEEHKSGLAKTNGYRDSLEEGYLEDEEFSRALAACQRALKDACEAEGAAERRRALMIKLSVAGAAVTAVVLLIAAGLWIRSSMRASALVDAVEQQNWDEALAIDGQHVPALIGRATQRLNAGPPDIEGAFADIGLAEQVDSTAAELKPAKALAHAKRATSLATDGKISESEKDLKEAESLGASDTQLTPVRQSLAAAYLKQAEEAAQSGNASQVVVSTAKAVEYNESISIPVAIVIVFADESVKQFEQSSSEANKTSALAAIATFQGADADVNSLEEYRQRVGAVLLTRSGTTVTSDLSAASSDYIAAMELGASTTDSASLKTKLVTALTARCRQSLGSQDMAKASADYAAVSKLDRQAAGGLTPEFEKLPVGVLSQLPANVLTQLPANVLLQLPANVLLQLPPRKNSIGMQFRLLPGGTFTMGEGGETHKVTLTTPFELGVYEVTQDQYEQVMGSNPSKFKGPQNPVEQVDWNDAVAFCRKLSELPSEKSGGYVYRLPTEAEWEYACRAGTTTTHSFGDSESELGAYAWYKDNSGKTTHPVGGKKPNAWGLYDMHGNVFEWCRDWYGDYPSGSATDPTGATSGSIRVIRGGSWNDFARYCRSASRYGYTPEDRVSFLGFRVLRSSIK